MKFDHKLDYSENLKARYMHRQNSEAYFTDYQSLNETEHSQLQALNKHLTLLENQYLPILKTKYTKLQERVKNHDDWIQDFNLEFVITFYLQKSDNEYEEDDDNILMELHENVFDCIHTDQEWGFGITNINHCDCPAYFVGEWHCYLYHCLYDHCGLDWLDLLRIGSVCVEIKIDEQAWEQPFPRI
ncbi:MAG: hypothetical protein ABL868_05525 [Sulfuriferula sp.]